MPFSRRVFVFFLGLLWASHTHALTWQATTIESRTEPFQKALTLTFAFKNTDDRRVAILDLQTDCSCITAIAAFYSPNASVSQASWQPSATILNEIVRSKSTIRQLPSTTAQAFTNATSPW